MATTNFKGQPVKLIGEFIQVGKVAPDFELVKTDLSSFSLKDLKAKMWFLIFFRVLTQVYVLLRYVSSIRWQPD